MELFIFLVVVAIILVGLWYLLPVIVGVSLVAWIINKLNPKQKPQDIPNNPYEEIYGSQNQNPFEGDRYTTTPRNPDVIDVEYTEHEDTEND